LIEIDILALFNHHVLCSSNDLVPPLYGKLCYRSVGPGANLGWNWFWWCANLKS